MRFVFDTLCLCGCFPVPDTVSENRLNLKFKIIGFTIVLQHRLVANMKKKWLYEQMVKKIVGRENYIHILTKT